MPQEPMTRKSAMAKVTNTVLRSTRSTKRPKSANFALASRKKKSTSHNNRYNSSSNNNNKHNNTNYNKYKNNRHEQQQQQQRMNVRKSNANKAYLSSSNLSNNFRHNRPSSAPHHRRGNYYNNSNNNTPGQGSTSPNVATSILQSNYIKLTPLEKREKGWSARPADMAGGIPVYDASKDRYCPLYSRNAMSSRV